MHIKKDAFCIPTEFSVVTVPKYHELSIRFESVISNQIIVCTGNTLASFIRLLCPILAMPKTQCDRHFGRFIHSYPFLQAALHLLRLLLRNIPKTGRQLRFDVIG